MADGCGRVSAGADLSELKHISASEAHRIQYLRDLSIAVRRTRKPIIASVEGFAVGPPESLPNNTDKKKLGGGFELVLMVRVKPNTTRILKITFYLSVRCGLCS